MRLARSSQIPKFLLTAISSTAFLPVVSVHLDLPTMKYKFYIFIQDFSTIFHCYGDVSHCNIQVSLPLILYFLWHSWLQLHFQLTNLHFVLELHCRNFLLIPIHCMAELRDLFFYWVFLSDIKVQNLSVRCFHYLLDLLGLLCYLIPFLDHLLELLPKHNSLFLYLNIYLRGVIFMQPQLFYNFQVQLVQYLQQHYCDVHIDMLPFLSLLLQFNRFKLQGSCNYLT